MYQETELHEHTSFLCPKCGLDDLTLYRVQVYNPCDKIIDIDVDPPGIGGVDGADGGRPYVTLAFNCAECSPDAGVYLHMVLEADGRTHLAWDTD